MLLNLTVENFILIQHLELELTGGFTCITGETGAGKSILVGALGLILGQRADSQVLMDKNKKCIVEGTFALDGYGLNHLFEENDLDFDKISIFRREINPQGKSRAFINDTPVNLSVMKEIGEKLLDIHSQNQTLELNGAAFQLAMIDSYAGSAVLIDEYSYGFKLFQQWNKELIELEAKEKKALTDKEYFEFQLEELKNAALTIGEVEELEEELTVLNHSEEIKTKIYTALSLLDDSEPSILANLAEAHTAIDIASRHSLKLESMQERIGSALIDLKDIVYEIRALAEHIHHDPERIATVSERLDLIYSLLQKHKLSKAEELIELRDSYVAMLNDIESVGDRVEALKAAITEKSLELKSVADKLHEKRVQVIPGIEEEMERLLHDLGMPAARFMISISQLDYFSPSGTDKVTFLFAANKGTEPREVQKVASGGELSRLMLAIKSLVVQRSMLPTILFDEIDTGVSGEIAGKIGNIMRKMSVNMQVVAITHLPQIAGKAQHHLLAYKEHGEINTISNLRKLSDEERLSEIARMLSDETITDSARAAAKELMVN